MKIQLDILKEDMGHKMYIQSDKCPITKAFARAGHPHLHDMGDIVTYQDNNDIMMIIPIINEDEYKIMTKEVRAMDTATVEHEVNPLKPKSFSFTVDLDMDNSRPYPFYKTSQ